MLTEIVRASGLDSRPERLAEHVVAGHLYELYGLSGVLSRIATEKDDTFRFDNDAGRYLVKIAPASEDRRIVNLQSSAMLHLERHAPDIPAQRLIPGLRGQMESRVTDPQGRSRVMRVLSYLDGTMLADTAATNEQLRAVGVMMARVDDALADFRHPCESRLLLWDLKVFTHLRPLIDYVENRDDRDMAHWVFDWFDRDIEPIIGDLQTQTIHGDFSPFNVLVDPARPEFVSGVIDFGDVVRSPVVFELSVAGSNQLSVNANDPWGRADEIVHGYQRVRALAPGEAGLLAVTVPARLLSRALIYQWRSTIDPDIREYAMSHSAKDWQRLRTALAPERN